MIRHVVFFSARPGEDVAAVAEGLRILTTIPHARRLEVALNTKRDQLANDVDVVVYGEFDDFEALAAYKAHPVYAEAVARVRPLRDMRIAADFVADDK